MRQPVGCHLRHASLLGITGKSYGCKPKTRKTFLPTKTRQSVVGHFRYLSLFGVYLDQQANKTKIECGRAQKNQPFFL